MASFLIAGGTGLVGSLLVQQLLAEGHSVTLVCRSMPTDVMAQPRIRAVVSDLMLPEQMLECLPREAFDAVVYLAQADNHHRFPANAYSAVALNISAPVALCQWAAEMRCGRFVYGSSGGICGSQAGLQGRITEGMSALTTTNLSFYLATKARCEELLSAFRSEIPVTLLRYFFVYGPGQRSNFLFPRMRSRIIAGEPIVLASGTGPHFNPIHARDAAYLTMRALFNNVDGPINIAGIEDSCLAEVVEMISKCVGTSPKTSQTPDHPANYLADITMAGRVLGRASISLGEGIRGAFGTDGARI